MPHPGEPVEFANIVAASFRERPIRVVVDRVVLMPAVDQPGHPFITALLQPVGRRVRVTCGQQLLEAQPAVPQPRSDRLPVVESELRDRKSTRLNSSHVKISYAV